MMSTPPSLGTVGRAAPGLSPVPASRAWPTAAKARNFMTVRSSGGYVAAATS